jgi:phosphate transporter
MSIPFWVVVLRVIKTQENGQDRRLSAPEATKYIFATMFSPTIMLLIGGFTLAAALSKHNIDKMLATRVLAFAGTRPRTVLLAYMGVACFASMWISNVAAPVLCYGLIAPILRTLPPKTQYAKALVIGIALASNIGGQSSPISSPQNLIALEYMNPPLGWLSWFAIALPVSAVSLIGIWVLLCYSYTWDSDLAINPIKKMKDTFTLRQYFVSTVVVATIVLWCLSHQIDGVFGDMGVIAIIPLILFFGSGSLRKVGCTSDATSMADCVLQSDFEAYVGTPLKTV